MSKRVTVRQGSLAKQQSAMSASILLASNHAASSSSLPTAASGSSPVSAPLVPSSAASSASGTSTTTNLSSASIAGSSSASSSAAAAAATAAGAAAASTGNDVTSSNSELLALYELAESSPSLDNVLQYWRALMQHSKSVGREKQRRQKSRILSFRRQAQTAPVAGLELDLHRAVSLLYRSFVLLTHDLPAGSKAWAAAVFRCMRHSRSFSNLFTSADQQLYLELIESYRSLSFDPTAATTAASTLSNPSASASSSSSSSSSSSTNTTSTTGSAAATGSAAVADSVVMQNVVAFGDYIRTHRVDAYNCLIGLEPSRVALDQLSQDLAREALEPITSHGSGFSTTLPVFVACDTRGRTSNQSVEQLVATLTSWAFIRDDSALASLVRSYTAPMRGIQALQCGDVVVVDLPDQPLRYARFTGDFPTPTTLKVWTSPDESLAQTISIERAIPLAESFGAAIVEVENLARLERIVRLPTDAFINYIVNYVHNTIPRHLADIGVALEVIKRAKQNDSKLRDIVQLQASQKEFQQVLSAIKNKKPCAFFDEVNRELSTQMHRFKSGLDENSLFHPTLQHTLKQLESFQLEPVVIQSIQSICGTCESALDQLVFLKRELISGKQKEDLSEWWLTTINQATEVFLANIGYNFEAVPENYIERPPADISQVHANSVILSEVLDANHDKYGVHSLVSRMRAMIYPKIEEFISDACAILQAQLNVPYDPLTSKDITVISRAFEAQKNKLSEEDRNWVGDLIKDVQYLLEMKLLEDPKYAATHGSLHIVPVSGLCMGIFCRLEYECKTVLELWSHTAQQPSESRTNLSQLHAAISNNDWKHVVELLAQPAINLNCVDDRGWTPMHLACNSVESFMNIQTLLACDGIDLNAKTPDGNTPLHFAVRLRPSSDLNTEYLALVRSMLQRGAQVAAVNQKLETPLHIACIRGGVALVDLLLQNGAPINAVNESGETGLHCSVRCGNLPIAKCLLRANATPDIESSSGTPIEMALDTERPDIARMIQEHITSSATTPLPATAISEIAVRALSNNRKRQSLHATLQQNRSPRTSLRSPNRDEPTVVHMLRRDASPPTAAPAAPAVRPPRVSEPAKLRLPPTSPQPTPPGASSAAGAGATSTSATATPNRVPAGGVALLPATGAVMRPAGPASRQFGVVSPSPSHAPPPPTSKPPTAPRPQPAPPPATAAGMHPAPSIPAGVQRSGSATARPRPPPKVGPFSPPVTGTAPTR